MSDPPRTSLSAGGDACESSCITGAAPQVKAHGVGFWPSLAHGKGDPIHRAGHFTGAKDIRVPSQLLASRRKKRISLDGVEATFFDLGAGDVVGHESRDASTGRWQCRPVAGSVTYACHGGGYPTKTWGRPRPVTMQQDPKPKSNRWAGRVDPGGRSFQTRIKLLIGLQLYYWYYINTI